MGHNHLDNWKECPSSTLFSSCYKTWVKEARSYSLSYMQPNPPVTQTQPHWLALARGAKASATSYHSVLSLTFFSEGHQWHCRPYPLPYPNC